MDTYPFNKIHFLGYKRHYIDKKTRVEYGFHFLDLGYSYNLERKIGLFWHKRAWAYGFMSNLNFDSVIPYLLWSEKNKHK